ncbi:hypothetical protein Tco_0630941 [Tanacetum coccineum]
MDDGGLCRYDESRLDENLMIVDGGFGVFLVVVVVHSKRGAGREHIFFVDSTVFVVDFCGCFPRRIYQKRTEMLVEDENGVIEEIKFNADKLGLSKGWKRDESDFDSDCLFGERKKKRKICDENDTNDGLKENDDDDSFDEDKNDESGEDIYGDTYEFDSNEDKNESFVKMIFSMVDS